MGSIGGGENEGGFEGEGGSGPRGGGGDGEADVVGGEVEVEGVLGVGVGLFQGAQAAEDAGGGVGGEPLFPSGQLEGEEGKRLAGGGAGDGAEGELGPQRFLRGVWMAVEEEEVGVVQEAGDAEFEAGGGGGDWGGGGGAGRVKTTALPERADQVTAKGVLAIRSLTISWRFMKRMG